MTDTNTAPQVGDTAPAPRLSWTTPTLRSLAAAASELGAGLTIDAEGHS